MPGPWERYAKPQVEGPWAKYAEPKAIAPEDAPADPTEGMGFYNKYRAGLGYSAVMGAKGLKQSATDAARYFMESNKLLFGDDAGSGLRASVERQTRDIDEERRLAGPLNDTLPGMLGNVVGTAAQFLLPASAARGTMLARAALPQTIRGATAQGAAYGALQPVGEGESRGMNAGIGAIAGGAGQAVPVLGAKLVRGVSAPIAPFTQRGSDRAVGTILRGSASDPASLATVAPSAIPGVQRSLAEETLDPGIAALQRAVQQRSGQGAAYDTVRRNNNAARVSLLDQFAGDDAAIAAAEAARDAKAMPLLGAAYLDKGVDAAPIRGLLDAGIEKNATRPTVQAALNDVKAAISNAGDDVASLYNVRKYIGDLLEGKAGSDKGYAQAATRELMQIKGQLDDQLRAASPSFGQYLDEFKAGSKPIDRMKLGSTLYDSGAGAVMDQKTGTYTLTPAAFGRQVKNLDVAAKKATGFKKARAANILEPQDMQSIAKIQDDLSRQYFADSAAKQGSDTFQKLMNEGNILGAMDEMGVSVPGSGILRMIGKRG